MAFDPKGLITTHGVITGFEAALKAAYEQGVRDGIDRIVAAAKSPIEDLACTQLASQVAGPQVPQEAREVRRVPPHPSYNPRAPRGLVPQVLELIMTDRPGLSIAEYETLATDLDHRLARKSIGNELRRGEGTKYERRGYRWFLQGVERNEAADAPGKDESAASSVSSNERNDSAAALV